jgi:hypothetical protein
MTIERQEPRRQMYANMNDALLSVKRDIEAGRTIPELLAEATAAPVAQEPPAPSWERLTVDTRGHLTHTDQRAPRRSAVTNRYVIDPAPGGAQESTTPKCVCGQYARPTSGSITDPVGVVHRADGPCYQSPPGGAQEPADPPHLHGDEPCSLERAALANFRAEVVRETREAIAADLDEQSRQRPVDISHEVYLLALRDAAKLIRAES